MLVLTRERFETVVIEGGIVVTVLECREGRVKLGFDAPTRLRIDRGEVAERIAEQARIAAKCIPTDPAA